MKRFILPVGLAGAASLAAFSKFGSEKPLSDTTASATKPAQKQAAAETAAPRKLPVMFNGTCTPRPATGDNGILRFRTEWCMIPHPNKAYKGGEDACFATAQAVAVADGVGGWESHGIDSGLYSNALMNHCKSKALAAEARGGSMLSASALLDYAWRAVEATKLVGSCTACVVTIDPQKNVLRTANLGDSGFMLLRPTGHGELAVVHRSVEQQFSFNFPYQLGTGSTNKPSNAAQKEIPVSPGDILVLGTDGLFDNRFDADIIRLVSTASASEGGEVARVLALAAFDTSRNSFLPSDATPFGVGARRAGHIWTGGKSDDITCLVATIVLADTSPPETKADLPPTRRAKL